MRFSRALATGFVIVVGACNDNDPTALARVDRVVLSPADTIVEHPDSFRYRVQLLDASGDVIEDTRPMTFQATNQAVVDVTSGGYVRTQSAGSTLIRATVGGTTGTAALFVSDAVGSGPGAGPPPRQLEP